MKKRDFIKTIATATAGLPLITLPIPDWQFYAFFEACDGSKFTEPIDPELFKSISNCDSNIPSSLLKPAITEFDTEQGNKFLDYVERQEPMPIERETIKTIGDLRKGYIKSKQDQFVARSILEANNKMIKRVVGMAGAAVATTGIGAIATGVIIKITDKLLDASLDEFDKSMEKSRSLMLARQLTLIEQENSLDLKAITGLTKEEARKFVFDKNKAITDENLKFLSSKDKDAALQSMVRMLEEKMDQGIALNKMKIVQHEFRIESIQADVKMLRKVQDDFKATTQQDIASITRSVIDLDKRVKELRLDVDDNSDNIATLRDYMYSNSTIDEKIAIISNEKLSLDIPKKKRDLLLKQLKVLKAERKLKEDIQGYINKGKYIVNILGNIGDPKIKQKVNKLANLAQTAMNAYALYSSGNFLGATSEVSNLFGSKKDASAAMHQRVMKKLGIIHEDIQDIRKTQIDMFKMMVKSMEILDSIRKDMRYFHMAEMAELKNVKIEILYSRFSDNKNHFMGIHILEDFKSDLESELLDRKESLTFEEMKVFFRNHGDSFERGKGDLLSVLSNPHDADLSEFILLRNNINVIDKINEDKELTYCTSVLSGYERIKDFLRNNLAKKLKYRSLLSITGTYSDLKEKINLTNSEKNSSTEDRILNGLLMKSFVATPVILKLFEIVSKIHGFFMLQKEADSTDELYEMREFFNLKSYSLIGKQRLIDLCSIVDIAIIQENLLAGDILLTTIYDILIENSESVENESTMEIVELLNANYLLKFNFANYLIKKQLDVLRTVQIEDKEIKIKNSLAEYYVFLTDNSNLSKNNTNSPLRKMFDQDLRSSILYNEDLGKWTFVFNANSEKKCELILPDRDTFQQEKIQYRGDMYVLLEIKSHLLDIISEYNLMEYLDDNSMPLFNHLRFN